MRRLLTLAVLTAASVGGAGVATSVAQAADACPNAAIRSVQGASALPDCRAYEKVTPEDKANSDITFWGVGTDGSASARASVSGDAVAFQSGGAFVDAKGAAHSDQYVSRRGTAGWSTTNLTPRTPPGQFAQFIAASGYQAFSSDLAVGLFQAVNDPADPDPEWGAHSLYLRNADGSIVRVSPEPDPDPGPFSAPAFTGASEDFTTVTFQTSTALVPGAPTGVGNLYVWRGGQLDLVADPAEFPDGASAVPNAAADATHRAVSPDGTQIVFRAGSPSQLWLAREGAAPVEISLSQNEDAGTAGDEAPSGAVFMGTTSTGGKLETVYFASADALTDDATVGTSGEGGDLYAYDVESGLLTDLVIDHSDPNGAQVNVQAIVGVGLVIDPSLPFLVSADGTRIYFFSQNALAANGQANSLNLYLLDHGSVRYAGPIPPASYPSNRDLRMSDDGRRLLYRVSFASGAPTSDDAGGFTQIYLYDVDRGWSCVSCRADGRPSTSEGNFVGGAPGWAFAGVPPYFNRTITADGRRVFFETAEALVPQDTNGRTDVYEWEGDGPRLISAGTGAGDSHFLDASVDGSDVFFTTRDRLTADDRDAITDVYDARVGGGFAAAADTGVASCAGDSCQGAPSAAPDVPVAASLSFAGSGDVVGDGGPQPSRRKGRVRVAKAGVVRGASVRLKVRVSGRGVVRVTGKGVRRSIRRTSRGATYRVTVRLTKAARRTLARRHRLKVRLRVRFAPRGGTAATVRVPVTFKTPQGRASHRPRQSKRRGGAAAARAAHRVAAPSSFLHTARKGR